MSALKTRKTGASVTAFLKSVENPDRRRDCRRIAAMMRAATGARPAMWGSSMVGYGRYHYRYASGREGDWFECGYAPRAQTIAVYIMPGFGPFEHLMKRLGKYRTGKSCLYIKRLDDVDIDVLSKLIAESVVEIRRRYPS